MDELIIGEQKYVSSKRAAELTGYAKDYIGQLCREGRVEARLVGRSWYVREAAIKDHRFGAENEPQAQVLANADSDTRASDISPRYEIEVPKEIQLINDIEGSQAGEALVEQPEENMADRMQRAWQDWFSANTGEVQQVETATEAQFEQPDTEELEPVQEETEVKIVKLDNSEEVISDSRDYSDRQEYNGGEEVSISTTQEIKTRVESRSEEVMSYRWLKIALVAIAVLSIVVVYMNFVVTTTSTSKSGWGSVYKIFDTLVGTEKISK